MLNQSFVFEMGIFQSPHFFAFYSEPICNLSTWRFFVAIQGEKMLAWCGTEPTISVLSLDFKWPHEQLVNSTTFEINPFLS